METQDRFAGAAEQVASKPADELQAKPPRKRRTKASGEQPGQKPDSSAQPAAQTQTITFEVDPAQLRQAIGPFLSAVADWTKTSKPGSEEVEGIAQTLAFGLKNTKLGISEKSGPWVPFALVISLYALPRAIEGTVNYFERRREREEARTFPDTLGAEGPAAGGVVPISAR